MPQRKHHGPEGRSEHEHDHEHDHDCRHDESGDDPRGHAAILARRWDGSEPPTLEHYRRALAQWHALSGTPAPRARTS